MNIPLWSVFQRPSSTPLDPRIQTVWDSIDADLRAGIGLYPSGKRSGAYFSPMPRGRGIYIADSFAAEESDLIKGVLLHELGHYDHYRRHGAKSALITLGAAWLAVLIALYNVVATALTFLPNSSYTTLAVFSFVLVNQLVLTPLALRGKRQREIEADAFAVLHGGGEGIYAHLSNRGAIRPQLEFSRNYSYLMSTHPPTPHRLYWLEQAGVKYDPYKVRELLH